MSLCIKARKKAAYFKLQFVSLPLLRNLGLSNLIVDIRPLICAGSDLLKRA